ncbi:MAG TPA: LptA/OstA family protein [Terriglobales bacterium]|nr:LptA/OstA family protein [Terriglobales bacterium]
MYAACGLVLVVVGYYSYARYRFHSAGHNLPPKLAPEIQKSSEGYTYSKSDHGRTLFTIHAAKALEYKVGGRARLQDVTIIVYGKESNRFDQIYGADFDYDPASGDVVAQGDVQIDLENNIQGPSRPDQAPPEILKNLVHIKTHGLSFSQKTGYAVTEGLVEFRLPQANGTAVGAILDSKSNIITLQSQVNVNTIGENPANIKAQRAVLTKQPRQAVLLNAHIAEKQNTFDTDKLTVFLREDNTVEHMLAEAGVHATTTKSAGEKYDVHAGQGTFMVGEHNILQTAVLHGNVVLDSSGGQVIHGTAGTAVIDFTPDRHPSKIHATEDVHFRQIQAAKPGKSAQQLELITDAVDIFSGANGVFQSAVTSGAARIEIQQAAAPKTVVTAGVFNGTFDSEGRIKTLHGEPDAKIVSPNPTPNLPDRVSTSQSLDVLFNAKSNENGIENIVQQGNVHYMDEERQAFSDHARYTPADQMLNLTGSPRVIDNGKDGAKMQTTAVTMRLNRGTGDAFAEGDVKTTYNNLKQQPSGAMLSSADPIHVTAKHMAAAKASGIAHYTGDVRLWQGPNVVEAPAIDFQREHRSMAALGSPSAPVKSVFIQNDSHGKQSPVHVTSNHLNYADDQRKARYEGEVFLLSNDGTMKSDHLDIYLTPGESAKGAPSPGAQSQGASQIDHAIAEGNVFVQQPARTAQGEKLVYTTADSKYVLTGTSSTQPSLYDAERGTVHGDSVTFYSQDDRVLVESSSSVRAVTQTRVK